MRKSKEKQIIASNHYRKLRFIHFMPLILAVLILILSSLFSNSMIRIAIDSPFLYPLVYFLQDIHLHWFLMLILVVIELMILAQKSRYYAILGFIISLCCGSTYICHLNIFMATPNIEYLDTFSTNSHIYYVTDISHINMRNKLGLHHHTILKCDRWIIICEKVYLQNIVAAEYYPLQLQILDTQLLAVYIPNNGGKEVIVVVIEENLNN